MVFIFTHNPCPYFLKYSRLTNAKKQEAKHREVIAIDVLTTDFLRNA